jgi:hypothetical protein
MEASGGRGAGGGQTGQMGTRVGGGSCWRVDKPDGPGRPDKVAGCRGGLDFAEEAVAGIA